MGDLTKDGADLYFAVGKHPAANKWNTFDDDERSAAVNYAKAILERAKGSTLDEPASGSGNDDIREDYALYEQALHVASTNPDRANAETSAINYDVTGPDNEPTQIRATMRQITPEAIRWMGWNRIEFVRA